MQKLLTIIALIYFVSSCNSIPINNRNNSKEKIDSVLWSIIKRQNLYFNKIIKKNKIALDINDLYILSSREYYPYLNFTIEHRIYEDEHFPYEIIVCYDSLKYFGISFCDIPFYNNNEFDTITKRNYQRKIDPNKLFFEKDLNTALKYFKGKIKMNKKYSNNGIFEKEFVHSIIKGMTRYKLKELDYNDMCGLYDKYSSIIKTTYVNLKCKNNALRQLEIIGKDLESGFPINDYYFIKYLNGIYKFDYSSIKNDSIKIELLNNECILQFIM